MRKGNLFVISGPSGTGKGTLIARMLNEVDDAFVSVSATTRSPRPGEVDGVNYYFMTPEDFKDLADQDGFLEWASYSGNSYGTPRAAVEQAMAEGKQVILEIEVQGALQVRGKMPEAHLIFIEPPSIEELEKRLRGRGTETDEAIQKRMDTALVELSQKMEYDVSLINDDLDQATAELVGYINEMAEQDQED